MFQKFDELIQTIAGYPLLSCLFPFAYPFPRLAYKTVAIKSLESAGHDA
jgi:hypothetical protein